MQLVRKYQTSGKIEEKQNKALDANKTMQEYATDWYTRRAATGRYEDQLGGDKLQGVLERINNTKPSRESFKNEDGSLSFYNTAKVQDTSRDVRGYHTKGTNFWSSRTLLLNRDTPWHEAIGHQIYDELPQFNAVHSRTPWFIVPEDKQHQSYLNGHDESQGDEKGANIWGFRGANRQLKDSNGNLYIDPTRKLSGKDIEEMRNKGAIIPQAFNYMSDDDIATLHNLYASNNRFDINDNMFNFT